MCAMCRAHRWHGTMGRRMPQLGVDIGGWAVALAFSRRHCQADGKASSHLCWEHAIAHGIGCAALSHLWKAECKGVRGIAGAPCTLLAVHLDRANSVPNDGQALPIVVAPHSSARFGSWASRSMLPAVPCVLHGRWRAPVVAMQVLGSHRGSLLGAGGRLVIVSSLALVEASGAGQANCNTDDAGICAGALDRRFRDRFGSPCSALGAFACRDRRLSAWSPVAGRVSL